MPVEDAWRQLISSELKGDLVVLFRKNPGIMDTAEGIARRVGSAQAAVEREVSELVAVGFLTRKELGKYAVYSLNEERDRQIQEQAAHYLESLSLNQGGR